MAILNLINNDLSPTVITLNTGYENVTERRYSSLICPYISLTLYTNSFPRKLLQNLHPTFWAEFDLRLSKYGAVPFVQQLQNHRSLQDWYHCFEGK